MDLYSASAVSNVIVCAIAAKGIASAARNDIYLLIFIMLCFLEDAYCVQCGAGFAAVDGDAYILCFVTVAVAVGCAAVEG